jgi:hypothetical protein
MLMLKEMAVVVLTTYSWFSFMKHYQFRWLLRSCYVIAILLNLSSCGNAGTGKAGLLSEKAIASNVTLDLSAGVNAVQSAKPATPESKLVPLPDDKPVKLFNFSKRKFNDNDLRATKRYEARLKSNAPTIPIDVDAEKLLELLLRGGMLSVEVPGAEEFKVRINARSKGEGTNMSSMYFEFTMPPKDKLKFPVNVSVGFASDGIAAGGAVTINDREFTFFSEGKNADAALIELDVAKHTDYHGGHPVPLSREAPKNEKLLNDKNPAFTPNSAIEKKAVPIPVIKIGFAVTKTAASAVPSAILEIHASAALNYLIQAFNNSNISVAIVRVPGFHKTEYSDFDKLAGQVLKELSALNTLQGDIATFRANNDIDILVTLLGPQTSRIVTGDSGGLTYIGGSASESTIVITTDSFASKDVLAHEIGHLLGADHHTAQRSAYDKDRSPYFGHITPQDLEFSGQRQKIDIMIDPRHPLSDCYNLPVPCERLTVFSDPSYIARTSGVIAAGVIENPGCANAFPFPATLPCNGDINLCRTYDKCPFPLAFGYCSNGVLIYKEVLNSANTQSCYPRSLLYSNPIRQTQVLGDAGKANVASLWKGLRPFEISTFSDQVKPQLLSTLATHIQAAFAGAIFD